MNETLLLCEQSLYILRYSCLQHLNLRFSICTQRKSPCSITFNSNNSNLYCQSIIVSVLLPNCDLTSFNLLILIAMLTAAFTARNGTISILSFACSRVIPGPVIPSPIGLPYFKDKSAINLAA